MTSKRKPCGRPVEAGPTPHGVVDGVNIDGCAYPRMEGKRQCVWHWLLKQSAETQRVHAAKRLAHDPQPYRARVRSEDWPEGERWCSGCQSFVPLFYCSGSRCKSCNSEAAHSARVEKVYGISKDDYDELLKLQNGQCFVCHRKPKTKRLAVDHDHKSGEVRGLLCPDNERGCNHAVLGALENSVDGPLAAARRLVDYLEDPPYASILRGRALTVTAQETSGIAMALATGETLDVEFALVLAGPDAHPAFAEADEGRYPEIAFTGWEP